MGDTLDIRLTVSKKSVGHLVYWTSGLALSAASRLLYLITDLSAAFHVGIFFCSVFLAWKQERLELPAHIKSKTQ